MSNFILLGTDTDVGKTTFALFWLHLFGESWEYWKPIETGESDSERVATLCPGATVHAPVLRLKTPVAPPLAARIEGAEIPAARVVAERIPRTPSEKSLLIETFGSPFSPFNELELQVELIRALEAPCVLVSASKLGAIGRTLQCIAALRPHQIELAAVVLLGELDSFAEESIRQHAPGLCVASITPPNKWNVNALSSCAQRQHDALECIQESLKRQRSSSLNLQILTDDLRNVWHPYTPLVGADEPLVCVGAKGEFLELADGRRVIDAISSWWTILHGHRHLPLMQALAEASQRLDHVLFAGVTHPDAIELADLLLGTMPWIGGRVFYSDNGSTAVEVALKMAYQYWCHHGESQRMRFVGFEHGYHGDTFGAMSVGRDPLFFGRFEPLLFGADIVPLDPNRLDEHLQRHAHETTAVILEPLVQGAGGMRMHSAEALKDIVEVTHRHGVLFIADEVMTGGGRTGTLWAHQAAGVVPDLVCAAKTLTGGILPLAATLVSPCIVAAFQTADRSRTFFHGHSFTANPLACAVAVRNMQLLLMHPLHDPLRIERFWQASANRFRDIGQIKEVRVHGSILAVEIDVPGGYLAEVGGRMRRKCLEYGVFLRPLGNVLYSMPPYCIPSESLGRIADAMEAAVRDLST